MNAAKTTVTAPRLRFPEFSGNWEEKRLGDVANITGGGTPESGNAKFWGGDINWFTPTEIKTKYLKTSVRKLTQAGLKKSSAKLLPVGTLLISTRPTICDIGIATAECTTNQFFQSLTVFDGESNEFWYYWISHNKSKFIKRSNGSTFNEIGKASVESIIALRPRPDEQVKIAAFLGAVDARLTELKARHTHLTQYKRGVMQRLFSQALRFTQPDGTPFPDWEGKRLVDVANKTASSLSANQIKEADEGYLVYGADGIIGKINTFQIEAPYFGIVKNGTGVGTVFKCEAQSSVLGTIDAIKATPPNSTDFVYHLFSNLQFRRFVSGSTIPHVYFSDYSQSFLKLPHPDEQAKIADFLSTIDRRINLLNQQLTTTESFKKFLLQQMFV